MNVLFRFPRLACILLALCLFGYASGRAAEPVGITASGVVFSDVNQNGKQDPDEKGVGQAAVSDGIRIVRTDDQGRYQLADVNPAKSFFIFISTPSGYTAWNRFYCAVPSEATNNLTADFALWPSPAAGKSSFKFVHITDTHVGRKKPLNVDAGMLIEDLREVESLEPDFIINTGDLIEHRNAEQLAQYQSALKQLKLPVVDVVGNHDFWESADNKFEKMFGPTYFSFDYGQKHFVVLNLMKLTKEQIAWLRQDLADQRSRGRDVLVFQHWPQLGGELRKMLEEFKPQAVLSGHWHHSRLVSYDGTLLVNTPPTSFGGIDISPRGFRLVECQPGKLLLDSHYLGCRQLGALITPAEAASVSIGVVPILVAAYDASKPAASVEYKWNDGGWKKMTPQNQFCWQAQEKVTSPGTNQVSVRVYFSGTNVLERHATFTATAASLPVPKSGQAWPMFHNDAGRTGVTTEKVVPPLRLAWFKTLNGAIHISSPVVAEGTVYIGVADEDNRGRAGIYALDGVTGAVKWQYATTNSIRHSVAVDAQRCYGVTIDGTVVALDKATGKLAWQYRLVDEKESWSPRWVMTAPLVDDNVVYVGSAPFFAALNATTGQEIWRNQKMAKRGDWNSCLSSPACDKERIYVGFDEGAGLFALDRKDGQPVWNNTTRGQYEHGYTSPIYSGGRLYYGSEMFHALDPKSGASVWSNAEIVASTAAVAGDKLVRGCKDGRIEALDSATGKAIWTYQPAGQAKMFFYPYSRADSSVISSPAIAGQIVYYGGADGQFRALDLQSGELLWSYDLGSPITSSPAVSGNTVYIAAFDGTVYAFTAVAP